MAAARRPLEVRCAHDPRIWLRALILLASLIAATAWPQPASAQGNPFSSCSDQGSVRSDSSTFEPIEGRPGALRHTLKGSVVISCSGTTIWADEIVYDDDTSDIRATGHVTFRQADLQVSADRAELNGKTKLGSFYNAHGQAQLGGGGGQKSMFGTMEPDVLFNGERIERIGPRQYRLRNGSFTTCVQPTPRWEMTGSNGTITLDKSVLLKNAVLKVKSVPLFYLPALYYPINKEDRATGFLLPTYGTSTVDGTNISNAFFWAIARNQDATFYHDWYSKTGQGFKGEYRFVASPGSQGQGSFQMLSRHGDPTEATSKAYRILGSGNYALPHNFRLLGSANYFTDIQTQQRYENVEDYSQRTRYYQVQLFGNVGRAQFSATAQQSDFFNGNASPTRTGEFPLVHLGLGDKPIGRSRIYYGASGDMLRNIRFDNVDDPLTDRGLWRFDGGPHVNAPLSSVPWLTASANAALELTYWSESLDSAGRQVPVGLARDLVTTGITATGPSFSRVFQTPGNGYADRFKHVIEPTFSLTRKSTFDERARVVQFDGIDYLVGGDTDISYGLTSRLLAHRVSKGAAGAPAGPGSVRDILDVTLTQAYHTNALAANFDQNYGSTNLSDVPTNPYTPLRMDVTTSPFVGSSGTFRMEIDSHYRAVRRIEAGGSVDARYTAVSVHWNEQLVVPGLEGFGEENRNHSLSTSALLKARDNHIGGRYGFTYDFVTDRMLTQGIIVYYNSQCCGLSVEYISNTLGFSTVPTNNRTLHVSFTLAGIGSFSNPLGSFGGGR